MKKNKHSEAIKREREKLNLMIEEAFEKDILILQNEAIQKQSRRVDSMVARAEKERG
ncbi:MAG: hypothetical protein PHO15_01245 [Eubacteriales bacterium]|nr:hypothetical protein [Eubacteriales bacterium]